jgi:hypothetical protein
MAEDFHNNCDEKGATVTLIKCKNGKICGGYTSTSWETSESGGITDPTTFVFSVDT